jgi:hypothetical protein
MLEKKIEELGKYFDGIFKLQGDLNCVKIIIPDKWKLYSKKTEEYTIESKVTERVGNDKVKIMLVGTSNASIIDLINFASEFISTNVEMGKKTELFNIKVHELASVFDSNRLSKLQNITFKFEKPKKVKQEPEPIEEEVIDDKKDDEKMSEESSVELDELKKLSEEKD